MFGCSHFSTTAPVQQTAFVICFQVLLLGSRESRDHLLTIYVRQSIFWKLIMDQLKKTAPYTLQSYTWQ